MIRLKQVAQGEEVVVRERGKVAVVMEREAGVCMGRRGFFFSLWLER